MSGRLEEFKTIFFTPPSYAVMNSFSPQILGQMDDAERAEAERLLLEAEKRGTTDPRAIQGLATLRSTAALPLIRKRLPLPDETRTEWVMFGSSVIEYAVALWQIERDPAAFYYPSTIARLSRDELTLIDACVALRQFPFAETIDAVRPLLRNDKDLVRCHAVQTILLVAGLHHDQCEMPEPAIRIMSNDNVVRENAIQEVKELIRHVRFPSINEERERYPWTPGKKQEMHFS